MKEAIVVACRDGWMVFGGVVFHCIKKSRTGWEVRLSGGFGIIIGSVDCISPVFFRQG